MNMFGMDNDEKGNNREDNYTCHGQIQSALSNKFYDLYWETKSARELWKSLEKKYGREDLGDEKYIVGEYLHYKMVEDKSVHEQAHEIQNLVTKIFARGIPIDERLQVPALIEMFPPSQNDFKITLKHKSETLNIDELMTSIQIEEKHREKNTKIPSNEEKSDPTASLVQKKSEKASKEEVFQEQ